MPVSTKQKPPKRRPSGGAAMRRAGRTPMLLGWLPEERETIRAAAEAEDLPMTQFVMRSALAAAAKVFSRKNGKTA
jgi:uncharacterized protein (DUF1778 family)